MARYRYTKEEVAQLEKELLEMDQLMIQEGQLRKSARSAVPGLEAWPALNNNNNPYHAYRFGMAMAGSPDTNTQKEGPTGGDFLTIAYTDGDAAILKGAAKQIGVSSKGIGSKKSVELDDINKASPVANRKRNRYGI
jgi:hypothetical protein